VSITKLIYNRAVIRRIRWGYFLIIFLTSTLAGSSAYAQGADSQFFPETGHYVTGEFLKVFNKASNPVLVYGFPITDAFSHPGDNRHYQYFEKALFLFDPDNTPGFQVKPLPLGKMLYPIEPAPTFTPISTGCQVFPDSGFTYSVCYAFLDFFQDHGGVSQFGYPISNFETREGMIVQYFQRARFEWHPELPSGNRVMISNLGYEYFKKNDENPELLLPNLGDNLPQSILALRVHTFPVYAVVPRIGTQTIYVVVQDQNHRPISGVKVNMFVTLPSGNTQFHDMAVTNNDGIAKITFDIISQSTGLAEVSVNAIYENITEQTISSFRIWW